MGAKYRSTAGVLMAVFLAAGLALWFAAGPRPGTETGIEGDAESLAQTAEQLRRVAACLADPEQPGCAAPAQPTSAIQNENTNQ